MTATATARPPRGSVLLALLVASHPGPGLVVTALATMLAVAADQPWSTVLVLALAVLAGQLTIGWVNDLLDAGRDRVVGRADKPLATGDLGPRVVVGALVVAGLACVALSLAAGWRGGLVHLVLLVGSAQAYNLGLKATAASWVPYAVAFGSLPAVASLAGPDPALPPWWAVCAGAALGVGAHVLNALPDLDDDARTGVRGLPHRLGVARARPLAAGLLVIASVVVVLGPGAPPTWAWVALVVVVALAVWTLVGRGRGPFWAAAATALVDVVLLVAR